MFLVSPYSFATTPGTMLGAIQQLGLTSSLQLCLDAGDADSYGGTSQTWTDVSGNSNNFYRGSTSASQSVDPTFNGSAGGESSSEYFSTDGGDYFVPVGSPTFTDTWHKANATFSMAGWMWVPSGSTQGPSLLRSIDSVSTAPGVGVTVASLAGSGRVIVSITNGSGVQTLGPATNDTIVENTWLFAAVSFSEASGASFVRENGVVELFASDTYSSPSAAAPSFPLAIWSSWDGEPATKADSGTRMNSMAAWNVALTQTQITDLYNLTKSRFGL